MQQNKDNYFDQNNEQCVCLLTEDADERLHELNQFISFLCCCIQCNDDGNHITNRELVSIFSMIHRSIEFVLSNMIYPGGLITKSDIKKCD
ncbi:TPA: hypothetical protein L7414_005067 [Escherichia coli]|nr:hypothetical protein [Escherichia coli]HDH7112109.1 hypothetical protein [Escherichia coli]